jgi:hypothetical protein
MVLWSAEDEIIEHLTAAIGRLCCKSRFALVHKNSKGRGRGFRVKMRGTSSPHVKFTGDVGNAIAAIPIGDCFPVYIFAKNSWPCNFRLLQHNLHLADIPADLPHVCFEG